MKDPRSALEAVNAEVAKIVMGQADVTSKLLAALLVGGHVLLEGVPGVAKTLLAKALARSLRLEFSRVQFTPDLMPSDVTGNLIYESDTASFRFRAGPIFTNLVLADEVNRAPPKTQAALLEAMEEGQVSIEGDTHDLPVPFTVIATQNPVEYEGTYPLPEAQLDRFLFKLRMGYPDSEHEGEVLRMHDRGVDPHDLAAAGVRAVAGRKDLAAAAEAAEGVTVSDDVIDYILALVSGSRNTPALALGVSPRGGAMMLRATKAWAYLQGRDFVVPDDVKQLAAPTWSHRIIVRPEAELEGTTAEHVLDGLLQRVAVPR